MQTNIEIQPRFDDRHGSNGDAEALFKRTDDLSAQFLRDTGGVVLRSYMEMDESDGPREEQIEHQHGIDDVRRMDLGELAVAGKITYDG